jgi:hypothetical protein
MATLTTPGHTGGIDTGREAIGGIIESKFRPKRLSLKLGRLPADFLSLSIVDVSLKAYL